MVKEIYYNLQTLNLKLIAILFICFSCAHLTKELILLFLYKYILRRAMITRTYMNICFLHILNFLINKEYKLKNKTL